MQKKTKIVSVRMSEGFHARVQRLARKDGRTKADWIRRRLTDASKAR